MARPDIGPDEIQAVHAVMESGWITQGAKVRELEAAFARLCGTEHAVATNTGTAALHVALLGLEVGHEDEVITTPLSCIASANPILFQGARPSSRCRSRDLPVGEARRQRITAHSGPPPRASVRHRWHGSAARRPRRRLP